MQIQVSIVPEDTSLSSSGKGLELLEVPQQITSAPSFELVDVNEAVDKAILEEKATPATPGEPLLFPPAVHAHGRAVLHMDDVRQHGGGAESGPHGDRAKESLQLGVRFRAEQRAGGADP